MVEAFEKTGKKCADKTIINEYGFSIIEPIVFHCPYKKMSSQQKKELGTFNELIDQNQEKQKEYWQQYQKKFQIISKNEKELSKYDKSTFRFILTYQYVAAFNGNQEMHYAIRYQLYDRIKNKEYAALEILDANTDQEEFSNLEQVIKHLNN